MGNTTDFYEVLNIPKNSSPQEIRRAYKALCKKWHPDKHPASSKPDAETRFKAITQAYEALHGRQCIDNAAKKDEQGESNHGRSSPCTSRGKDFMNTSYSPAATQGFTYSSSSTRRKPPPVERKLECTLEELCRGCKKEIKFTRDVVTKDGSIVKQEETQTIRVKPGWKKGTKITFEGMGDERPGCHPPDIVFMISQKEHPIFKRVGNDLVLKVQVPLVSALTGWAFSVRLLTGEKLTCSFQDDIIYPGYEKVIQGQGMPLANDKGKKGDLRIKFHIIFPLKLSTEQQTGIMQLLKDST